MTEVSSGSRNIVRAVILDLVSQRGVGKTICPSEAAKAVSEESWRRVLTDVRAEAVRLAKSGDITIYRKGRSVDPDNFKGVYRLGLPGKPLPGSDGTT
ncbi:MAG: DUF3253 domain-containing protein [Pseudomonadota bacterium]